MSVALKFDVLVDCSCETKGSFGGTASKICKIIK